jgi:hypothetical protein
MLVLAFDERSKMEPYLAGGHHYKAETVDLGVGKPVFMQEVRNPEGEKASRVRIESFFETNPDQPEAWITFRALRLPLLKPHEWGTIVFDSATSMCAAARYWDLLTVNRNAGDNRSHYNVAKEQLDWLIRTVLPGWYNTNVVFVAHVSKPWGAGGMRKPAFPGQLANDVGGGFGEVYHAFLERGKDGKITHVLQTRKSPEFDANTMIGAGAPRGLCAPTYEALWTNYEAPQARTAPVVNTALPELMTSPLEPLVQEPAQSAQAMAGMDISGS